MSQENSHKPDQDYTDTQVVNGLGTTGQLPLAIGSALAYQSDQHQYHQTHCVRFDATDPPLDNIATLLDVEPHALLNPDEFVCSTVTGDTTSIAAWERSGKLRFLSRKSFEFLSSQIEKEAAGGDPCFGLSQYLICQSDFHDRIDHKIRRARGYDLQTQRVVNDDPTTANTARLTVSFIASGLGGTGNAGIYHTMETTAPRLNGKRDQAFDIKLFVLHSFSLPVQNRTQAAANQFNLLKHIDAVATGFYCHPISGQPQSWPFNELCLISDQGRWGVISDCERCVGLAGHLLHHRQHGPQAGVIRARLRDCENIDTDEWGEPRCVTTSALAYLSWDRLRAVGFSWAQAGINLLTWLLNTDSPQTAQQRSHELEETCGLIESEDRNDVTGPLLQTQIDGEPALQRVNSLLRDQVESARSSRDVIEAHQDALENYRQSIEPDIVRPAVKAQARQRLENAKEALEHSLRQIL